MGIELIIALIIAGGAGYYFAKQMKKEDSTGSKSDPASDACNVEFDKMPTEARSQVLAALKEAQAKGGAAGAAVIKSASDVVRLGYPAAAKCLDDAAAVMAGAKTDTSKEMTGDECSAKLKALPEAVREPLKIATMSAYQTGGKAGADILRAAADPIRAQYPVEAKCLDKAAAEIEKLPQKSGGAPLTVNPGLIRNSYAPQTQGGMPPVSMKKIVRRIGY